MVRPQEGSHGTGVKGKATASGVESGSQRDLPQGDRNSLPGQEISPRKIFPELLKSIFRLQRQSGEKWRSKQGGADLAGASARFAAGPGKVPDAGRRG